MREADDAGFRAFLTRVDMLAAAGRVEGLRDLQRLLMRPIQSEHMVAAYVRADHRCLASLDPWNDFGLQELPSLDGSFRDLMTTEWAVAPESAPPACLGRDAVLPTCWRPASITQLIGNIGAGRACGQWQQDSNHSLVWWYPLNLYWVLGGNHSIAQGVLLGEGSVRPDQAYDLRALLPHVVFDGARWVDRNTAVVLGRPRYKELGYVFEVGRRLSEVETPEWEKPGIGVRSSAAS